MTQGEMFSDLALEQQHDNMIKALTMKQTAVEWLVEQLPIYGYNVVKIFPELLEQAKEMEKQQIIEAYYKSQLDLIEIVVEGLQPKENPDLEDKTDAEQYYNETYNK
jgi:hypothetical protein